MHQWISDDICRKLWLEFHIHLSFYHHISSQGLDKDITDEPFPLQASAFVSKNKATFFVTEGNGARVSMVCVGGHHKVAVPYSSLFEGMDFPTYIDKFQCFLHRYLKIRSFQQKELTQKCWVFGEFSSSLFGVLTLSLRIANTLWIHQPQGTSLWHGFHGPTWLVILSDLASLTLDVAACSRT